MLALHVTLAVSCLTAWSISSVVHLHSLRKAQRSIRLPTTEDEQEDAALSYDEDRLSSEERQAFSFFEKQHNIDGKPVKAEAFVRHVRRSRIWISALSTFALCATIVHLILKRPQEPLSWYEALHNQQLWPLLSNALLWVNTLFIVLQDMQGSTQWTASVQAATLTLFVMCTSLALLVVPEAIQEAEVPFYSSQAVTALLGLLVAINVPTGPRHTKETEGGDTVPMARVGRKGKTIVSLLWFTNCIDLVQTARRKGSLDPIDVPEMGSDMDANRLYVQFEHNLKRNSRFTTPSTSPKRRRGRTLQRCWPLLRTVVASNTSLFVATGTIASLTGFTFYVPYYVSFQIIRFLEDSEREGEKLSGWTRLRFAFPYILLLVGVLMLTSLAMAQLFDTCMTWLRTRVRAQLQMTILIKALRRKDINNADEVKDKKADKGAQKDDDEDGEDDEDTPKSSYSKTQVVNLVSVDAERFANLNYLIVFCMAPVEIVVGGFFAIYLLKWGAVVGLLTSILAQPVVFYLGKLLSRFEERLQESRDRKTSLLNEVIQAIRMVKFNAWEAKAARRIQLVRDEELKHQRHIYLVDLCQSVLFSLIPSVVILTAYAWTTLVEKKPLTPGVAFTAFSVLEELRFALTYIPDAVAQMIQALVSLGRIQTYLESEEIEPIERIQALATRSTTLHDQVFATNATIRWPVERRSTASPSVQPSRDEGAQRSSTFTLTDITVHFKASSLNLVVGKLGSGKTLLIQGLLGEADLLSGQLSCPRSLPNSVREGETIAPEHWLRSDQLSYVPQSPFLVNATLRENILFGLPFSEDRYDATIFACGLKPDLSILEDGDETEIGENGIGLSGGQSIRVMLARAIYGRACTLLLDDPLSAVDAHTAAHIHTNLLCGSLCAGRTVVLVTHQVQLVAQSSAQVVMLDGGAVVYKGEPLAFMKSDLYGGLIEEQEQEQEQELKQGPQDTVTAESSTTNTPATTAPPSPRLGSSKHAGLDQNGEDEEQKKASLPKKPAKKLVEEEKRAKGAVLLSIYGKYIRSAGGRKVVIATLATFTLVALLPVLNRLWLQKWSNDVLHGQEGHQRQHNDVWWLLWWALLWLVEIVLDGIKALILSLASLRASRVLFKEMLASVLKASLRFHDTVSRGRLLNRFGKDFEEMDSEMVDSMERLIDLFFLILISLFAIVSGGGVYFLLFFALTIPFYVYVGYLYMLAARDLKRLSSTTVSPILNTFGDVVRGTPVIRAFGVGDLFTRKLAKQVNENSSYSMWMNQARWWYEQLFHTISYFIMMFATSLVLLNENVGAGQAGFVFTFLINFNLYIIFFLQSVTNVEQKLVRVERIVEYANLDGEEPLTKDGNALPSPDVTVDSQWPAQGQVTVNDLHARYAAGLPEVLHGVSFSIPAGSKVGVVGPTGCGKSTLASSFFRFVDFTKGSISVDGVDVSAVDLQTLRSRLQIVPQDPIIFSGPLRASLDVFDEYTDEEVLDALRKVQLISDDEVLVDVAVEDPTEADAAVSKSKRNFRDLSFPVAEGGSNLSNGEKQLLCLARAVLRRCRLILFDEATSSVDFDTDAKISQIIRQEFAGSTIVTIAHRLRTIIDYDFVLVMNEGRVAEFASPKELLQDSSSRFYKLCRATGKRELTFLKTAAGLE